MASRKHDSGTSEKAPEKARVSFILNPDSGSSEKVPKKSRISFLLNADADDAVRTQPPRASQALSPAQQSSSSKSTKDVSKKRDRNYICETCGYGFYTNGDLKKHVSAVHLLLRPYGCPMCDKKFGEKSNANKHFKTVHAGQKNAACEQCDKVFAFRDGLLRHVRLVHENVRDYHCRHPGCCQSFKQKAHLKKHEKVHSRPRVDGGGKYRSS